MLQRTTVAMVMIGTFVTGILVAPKYSLAIVPVFDDGVNANTQAIQAAAAAIQKAVKALEIKEYELDPNARNANITAAKKMVAEMTKFVNSGYDGQPAFVTSLKNFMKEISLITSAEFAYSDALDALPEAVRFSTRVSLINKFNDSLNYNPAPTRNIDELTNGQAEDFYKGNYTGDNYLDVFYAMTQDTRNEPIGAFLAADVEMQTRNLDAILNESQQLEWSQGYLVMRYCEDTPTSSGGIKRECINTQPGSLVKDIVSQHLGKLPSEILLAGDELDEGISNTFANLSSQIVSGQNGLLGIGASPLSVNTFGNDGQSSYLNVLSDNTIDNTGDQYNPIKESLDAEIYYQTLQQRVIDAVVTIEETLAAHASSSDCFNLKLSDRLKEDKDTATAALEASMTVKEILELLNESYLNAATQTELDAVLEQYMILKQQGVFTTQLENQAFEIQFINYEFRDRVADFKAQITAELNQAAQQCPNNDSDNNPSANLP